MEGELVDPEEQENSTELVPLKPRPPPRVGNLASLPQIRREIAHVYRDARRGAIETQDGSRLIYMLDRLFDAEHARVKMSELERQRTEQGMPVFTGFDVKLLPTGESNE